MLQQFLSGESDLDGAVTQGVEGWWQQAGMECISRALPLADLFPRGAGSDQVPAEPVGPSHRKP